MNTTLKRNVVVSAVLVIALCVSLIAGATFALFTSESRVDVSVKSGTVDVTATASEPTLSSTLSENLGETSVSSNGNTVTLDKIVAGDVVNFTITIHNASDVSVKYRTVITKVTDDGLWDGLVVKFDEVEFEGDSAKKSEWALIAPESRDVVVNVEVALPESATSRYSGKSCTFAYTVEAVQGNADVVSEWNGTSTTAPEKDNDNVYHITSAAEFVEYITTLNCGNASKYTSAHAVLDTNVDLGGHVFEVSGEGFAFAGTFDGQGHTVSNYTVKRTDNENYTGLFSVYSYENDDGNCCAIKNLTVKNGTVIGYKQVSAIMPSLNADNSYNENHCVVNCHAVDCTVIGVKKVGAVVGYNLNGLVKDCTATNCTVYASSTDVTFEQNEANAFGFLNQNGKSENNVATGCTVMSGVSLIADGVMLVNGVYEISNANGLKYCRETFNDANSTSGKSFALTADIELDGIEWDTWVPDAQQYFNAIFDGRGHTIKNMTINNDSTQAGAATGFVGRLGSNGANTSACVKNVIFENANVTGHHNVGVAVGYNEFGSVENVTVKSSHVTATCAATEQNDDPCGDKAGAIIGFIGITCPGANSNLHAENCTVTAARDAAQVIGFGYSNNSITNVTATSVTVSGVVGTCTHGRAGQVSSNALVGNGTEAGLTLNNN